jgi:crotonobetainyl-CoA:carnitine CoA-transferase CaiB-like acyl-CoA transferase
VPHLRERGTVRQVSDPALGTFDIPGPPARFSSWTPASDVSADRLGGSNDAVLSELGLTPEEIAALHAEKVFVRDESVPGERAKAAAAG